MNDIAEYKDVWVFTEIKDHVRVHDCALEILGKAREIADKLGQRLVGILLALDAEQYIPTIEEHGIVWGSFMATDRLLRCNPWAYESFNKYYVGIENRKIRDPIENNYIFDQIRKESTRHTR